MFSVVGSCLPKGLDYVSLLCGVFGIVGGLLSLRWLRRCTCVVFYLLLYCLLCFSDLFGCCG
ncbi:hypothetical protein ANAPH2_01438 [Anaplasma phagocytophilum]|nr:hypothetical protein ANAPH2_01438 [Anaplasma phagocytophilum]